MRNKKRFEDFNGNGSGWSLEKYRYIDLNIRQVNDLRGGCDIGTGGMINQKDNVSIQKIVFRCPAKSHFLHILKAVLPILKLTSC